MSNGKRATNISGSFHLTETHTSTIGDYTMYQTRITPIFRLIINHAIAIQLWRVLDYAPQYSMVMIDSNGYRELILTVGMIQLRLFNAHEGRIENNANHAHLILPNTNDTWYLINKVYDDMWEVAKGEIDFESHDRIYVLQSILKVYQSLKDSPEWTNTGNAANVFYTMADMLSRYTNIKPYDTHLF